MRAGDESAHGTGEGWRWVSMLSLCRSRLVDLEEVLLSRYSSPGLMRDSRESSCRLVAEKMLKDRSRLK